MLIEGVVERISDSIEELGRIFDQIYKIPIKLREKYFDQIQKFKDKLISLKTNAKQSNLPATQKNYKQIYLNLHRLKEEISDQINLIHNKENRDYNRPNLKQTRRNHDDAMKLIVEKDQKIEQFGRILFEKQELIKVSFEELRRYKRNCEQLSEQYKMTKDELSQLQIEYSSLKSVFIKAEEKSIDLQLKDQQREQCFREALSEMQAMKQQLLASHQRLKYYEELAESSIKKGKVVEENIRIIEMEAMNLNEKYRKYESENMRKMKEIQELGLQLIEKDNQNLEMEIQIDKLNHEIQVLQDELSRRERGMHDQRAVEYDLRTNQQREIHQLQEELQKQSKEASTLNEKVQELQGKIQRMNKTNEEKQKEIRSLCEELQQTKEKVEAYLMMSLNLESIQGESSNELNILRKQKEGYDDQLKKSLQLSRQLEEDISNYKEKLKAKEEEKIKVIIELEKCQRDLRGYERDKSIHERSLQALQKEETESRTCIVKLQQKLKQKQREIDSLKLRFLRAKIEIIHEIRQGIA